ncbi:MAG: hypothetical protein WAV11_01920 [Minisyncoccia bacterium]
MFTGTEGRIRDFFPEGIVKGKQNKKVSVGDIFDYKRKMCIVQAVDDNINNRAQLDIGLIPVMNHKSDFFWVNHNLLV